MTRAVGDARKDVLEPMDVVLDGAEPDHPAVALQGVQRAEGLGDDLRVDAVALQGQEAVVEGLEVLAGVLEVDGEQLGRDLEVERHESRLPEPYAVAAVIFSMRPCSSEAWKGFFT